MEHGIIINITCKHKIVTNIICNIINTETLIIRDSNCALQFRLSNRPATLQYRALNNA